MTRDEICRNCRMLPMPDDPYCPYCEQPSYPIDENEWRLLGVNPSDPVTKESLMRMAEISIRPYCLAKMKAAGLFDYLCKFLE